MRAVHHHQNPKDVESVRSHLVLIYNGILLILCCQHLRGFISHLPEEFELFDPDHDARP